MNANEKLDQLERAEKIKSFCLWTGTLAGLILALSLAFYYFYSDDWSQRVAEGVVIKVVPQPSDTGNHFVIEIDLGNSVILVSENYPPEIVPGDQVQVRISSNESGTKHKYFRLREPRT